MAAFVIDNVKDGGVLMKIITFGMTFYFCTLVIITI